MKRFFMMMVSIIFGLSLLASNLFASAEGKGNRIFLRVLMTTCKSTGFQMAQKHTQEEWAKIYKAGMLNQEIERLCPGAKDLKDNEIKYVSTFFHAFASDSGQVVAG